MKNRQTIQDDAQEKQTSAIPELKIINLETDSVETVSAPERNTTPQTEESHSGINMHIVFFIIILSLFLIFIFGLIYRFLNWGRQVDPSEIFMDGPGEIDNKLDQILPAMGKDNKPIYKDYGEGSNIVFFGNAPFADDRDSEDNLVNMIQQMTGANVYNCSVSGSYLAASHYIINAQDYPEEVFNFYWLCHMAIADTLNEPYLECVKQLGDDAPEYAMDIYNTLNTLDFNTVDAVVVMYDASDYLAGHEMYSDSNDTDIVQFTGSLEAGIELLQSFYPNIRIIVLSPPYAYGIDENGDYISSDIQRYGQDVLSTYVIMQYQSCCSRQVTFIDNLYGTITEDNASEYLIDNLHLNIEGRRLIARRFVDALNYYSKN